MTRVLAVIGAVHVGLFLLGLSGLVDYKFFVVNPGSVECRKVKP